MKKACETLVEAAELFDYIDSFQNKFFVFNLEFQCKVHGHCNDDKERQTADSKHHEAIAFMDTKKELIEESSEPYRYRQELADCYVHTGDYPILEQYRLLRSLIDSKFEEVPPGELSAAQLNNYRDIMDVCFLKEEFRIYLKMGDLPNIREYSRLIQSRYDGADWDSFLSNFTEEQQEELSDILDGRNFEDGFRLELIQGQYITDPDTGIAEMEKYTIEVANSKNFSPVYKLKLFNELLRMLFEQEYNISARHYLECALRIVDSFEYNRVIYPRSGRAVRPLLSAE